MRMVMSSIAPKESCTWRSSGIHLVTWSSRDNRPRSRSCRIAIAVSVLVIEAQ